MFFFFRSLSFFLEAVHFCKPSVLTLEGKSQLILHFVLVFAHAGFMLLEKLEILEDQWDLNETGIRGMTVSE